MQNFRSTSLWAFIMFSLLLAVGCGERKTNGTATHEGLPVMADARAGKPDSNKTSSSNWIDSLLRKYVRSSESIRKSRENIVGEEWLFDQALHTDTAEYLIYQVGRDVSEEDGTDPRFATDQWVYIDTITRKLYEYDLPNDSLVLWVHGI